MVRTPRGKGEVSRIAKEGERERLQQLAGNYKTFRDARRRVARLFKETVTLVNQLEAARIVHPLDAKETR